jgi:hypothetical protein
MVAPRTEINCPHVAILAYFIQVSQTSSISNWYIYNRYNIITLGVKQIGVRSAIPLKPSKNDRFALTFDGTNSLEKA